MDVDAAVTLGRGALTMAATLAGPLLFVGLAVGLIISIFQTITSVQEQTLTFVPKLVAVLGCFAVFMPWFIETICAYTTMLLQNLDRAVR